MSAAGEAAIGAVTTDVVDLTLNHPRGSTQTNIYVSLAQTAGGYAGDRTHYFLQAAGVGATKFTVQGTLAGSGTNPPAADSTAGANDFEGLISQLDGHAVTDASVYPAGFQAGYINTVVGDTLNLNVISNALFQVFDGPNGAGYRADPAEIICEGGDAKNLGDALAASSGNAGYRFFITPSEANGVRAGAAVSEFVNPVTRNIVRIMVHPFWPQGVALGMSYQLPATWTNVANCFEMTMVQDYLSIAWPVIDASFRYSIFAFGALVGIAPQYSFILKGLQRSSATPYS